MRTLATHLARLLATLLVAAWAAQPLALVVHGEAHGHSYCAEHRAFEEGDARGPTLTAEDAAAQPHVTQGDADGTPRRHQACAVLLARTQAALATSSRAPLPMLAVLERAQAGVPVAAFPPLSVLDTAPKSSPPA